MRVTRRYSYLLRSFDKMRFTFTGVTSRPIFLRRPEIELASIPSLSSLSINSKPSRHRFGPTRLLVVISFIAGKEVRPSPAVAPPSKASGELSGGTVGTGDFDPSSAALDSLTFFAHAVLPAFQADFRPDRASVDVITLYPGGLGAEDFIAKVENALAAAEFRGIPYTGVLLDGIHNVFIQYPLLENDADEKS